MRRAILAMALLVAACGSAAPATSATAVVLTEGHIAVDSVHLAAGAVTLDIANVGQFPHTLVVTDTAGAVLAATGLIAPGESATLVVDLVPGDYQFSCRIVSSAGGEVFDHYQMGMVARVEASGVAAYPG